MSSDQLKDVESDKIVTNYDEVVDSFDALGLKEQLLRGIYYFQLLLLFTC